MAHIPRLASGLIVATTFVLAGTVFLPWTRSGRVSRSGWDVVGSARRLGVVDSGASEVALLVFFAVPMLAFMALVLHSVQRYSAVAAVATTTILTTVLVAVAVSGSPLGLRWGLWLNIAVAVVDGLLVVWLVSVIRLTDVVRSRS